jgi:hypothetical protein
MESRPIGIARRADPNILVTNNDKRKVRMATPVGFEAKSQEYGAEYGAGSYPYKPVFGPNTNAFVVYKELNGEEGYQAGKDDAKYVNGYYFTPSKMEKNGLDFGEQAKSLQSGTPWTIDGEA